MEWTRIVVRDDVVIFPLWLDLGSIYPVLSCLDTFGSSQFSVSPRSCSSMYKNYQEKTRLDAVCVLFPIVHLASSIFSSSFFLFLFFTCVTPVLLFPSVVQARLFCSYLCQRLYESGTAVITGTDFGAGQSTKTSSFPFLFPPIIMC